MAGGVVTSRWPVGRTSTHSARRYSGTVGVVPGEVQVVAAAVAGVAVVADPAEGGTGFVLDRLGPVREPRDRQPAAVAFRPAALGDEVDGEPVVVVGVAGVAAVAAGPPAARQRPRVAVGDVDREVFGDPAQVGQDAAVDHVALFVGDRGRDRHDLPGRVDRPRGGGAGARPARRRGRAATARATTRRQAPAARCGFARSGHLSPYRHPPRPLERPGDLTRSSAQADKVRAMPTVREASFDLFRARGMTTMFGNPGSTELPMLADFPADFRYVLGLQEAVVVGMADGYAQASGRASVANLHTAPGVGNAMGAIFNAQANHSPRAGHRRPADPGPDHPAGQPHQPRRDPHAAPAGQVVLRAGPRRGRAARARPRRPPRRAAAQGPDLRLDPDGRLVRRGRRGGRRPRDRPRGERPRRRRPRGRPRPRRAPRRRLQPGPGRRPRHRRQRRLGRRRRPRRAPAPARSGRARRPAAPASASPRAIPTSAASCRRRSARSARPSRATT